MQLSYCSVAGQSAKIRQEVRLEQGCLETVQVNRVCMSSEEFACLRSNVPWSRLKLACWTSLDWRSVFSARLAVHNGAALLPPT